MLTIAIYFDGSKKLGAPLNDPMYFASYRDFANYCESKGDRVVVVRDDSYMGNMTFRSSYKLGADTLIDIAEPVTADIIYMKAIHPSFVPDEGDLVVNPLAFNETNSKWEMYQLFPELMPKTYLITAENWHDVIKGITTDQLVLKPVSGSGGKGILIVDRATLDFPSLGLDVPYIAQEFVDSSAGIPGLCDGYHDLRVLMFNGEPKLSYLRIPQPGKLLSNISQGASAKVVPISDVPQAVLDMARKVDEGYQHYSPRHYSADFFMDRERPYLVETNTQPGFPRSDAEGEAFQMEYYEYLWQLLTTAVHNHKA